MKSKVGDNISREDILSCLNANEARHPFLKEQNQIELSKSLFKLNQLVQGIQHIFLEKGVVQRTCLLTNLTTRSCDNMAILLEKLPEYHEPWKVT